MNTAAIGRAILVAHDSTASDTDRADAARTLADYAIANPPRRVAALQECVGFFASAIRSGEEWTPACQRALDSTKEY